MSLALWPKEQDQKEVLHRPSKLSLHRRFFGDPSLWPSRLPRWKSPKSLYPKDIFLNLLLKSIAFWREKSFSVLPWIHFQWPLSSYASWSVRKRLDAAIGCLTLQVLVLWKLQVSLRNSKIELEIKFCHPVTGTTTNSATTSGLKICNDSDECPAQLGVDFTGSDITTLSVGSFEECRDACRVHPTCQACGFTASGPSCWLKFKVPSPNSAPIRISQAMFC